MSVISSASNMLRFQLIRLGARLRNLFLAITSLLINRRGTKSDGSIVLLSFGRLGDFIIWLAAAREIRKLFCGCSITLGCSEDVADLAKATGYFDRVLTYTSGKKSILSHWRELSIFSQIECDTLIQCYYRKDYLAALIKARRKLSVTRDNMHPVIQKLISKVYDEVLPFDLNAEHMLLQQSRYLRYLGWDGDLRVQELPRVNAPRIIKENYFIVFPGASDPVRRWNIDNFIETALYVAQKYHLKCCICGGKDERELAQYFEKRCYGKIDVINMVEKTTVWQLTQLIQDASLVVTNDTSAVHIAVGVRTPSVCVYGLWDAKKQALPYPQINGQGPLPLLCFKDTPCRGCNYSYTLECLSSIQKTGRRLCIEAVTVESVLRAVDKAMNGVLPGKKDTDCVSS